MTSRLTITTPGVYTIPAATYHADPVPGRSLSHTGAIKLLPPSCPAKFDHWRHTPEEPNREFDIGRSVHDLVLRGEDAVVIIDAEDWRTKEARRKRDEAYGAGLTPLLIGKWQDVQAMAEALWRHPVASALLRGGRSEQSIFWRDELSGVWLRALLDFLPVRARGDMYGVDYKSCRCAHPDAIARAMWDYRYNQQAAWYLNALSSADLIDDGAPFYFVFQEKSPPYVVTIAQLDDDALRWGRKLNRQAIDIYRRCVAANRWHGYSDEPVSVSLPTYAEYQLTDAAERGDFKSEAT